MNKSAKGEGLSTLLFIIRGVFKKTPGQFSFLGFRVKKFVGLHASDKIFSLHLQWQPLTLEVIGDLLKTKL